MQIFNKWEAKKLLPKRPINSNKKTFGKVLVFAGSDFYLGAGLLSCRAAFRMGAGYVYWISKSREFANILNTPEIIFLDNMSSLNLMDMDAVLVGPGLGVTKSTLQIIEDLMPHPRVILDADALTVLSQEAIKIPDSWILTPHPGEMGRLLNVSVDDVQGDRISAITECYRKYGCTILLKGYRSLVKSKDHLFEIPVGNSALSKAGSGDVLSGFIVTLRAQGLTAVESACLGAYIHGAIAEEWIMNRDERALLPSDIIEMLPSFLKNHF